MLTQHIRTGFLTLLLLLLILLAEGAALAQTTAFTYQGRLTDGGTPANGNYDLQFALWDSASSGSQIGSTQTVNIVPVSSGIFTVTLDFGANAFPGANRFLEISARPTGASSFILLSPRQPITSTPYAVRSSNATLANTATNATQLGGVGASQYVQTNDSRLTDARSPTTGSSNYIQNTNSPQSSSNFNISGDGTAGGTLAGNVVNATTQYNIAGSRVISNAGNSNMFVGVGAGNFNTTGGGNSFFGSGAGLFNTTGGGNSFFGSGAGIKNTTGSFNSFFGGGAGSSNTTGGSNSFVGFAAGSKNTTGASNSFFGNNAGQANTTGQNNSFFGAIAGLNNTTGDLNSFFGSGTGGNNTTGASNSFFGANAGRINTTGSSNAFFGNGTGQANTTGNSNAFFGNLAGQANTTGFSNSFFGTLAGNANATGQNNSFFGGEAGFSNTTGQNNAFFGQNAGLNNTTGLSNSFFGQSAGQVNTTGNYNALFGVGAGSSSTTGDRNSFFGQNAGLNNTTGFSNSFFGQNAGLNNMTGSHNTVIGEFEGANLVSGDFNIYLASNPSFDESNTIRIGNQGTQTSTFIAGINVSGVSGAAVFVNNSGRLGVAPSSRRFKEEIRDMGDSSSRLMRLRPVTFFYRPEAVAGPRTLQYGLIAEEVAPIYPELVEYTAAGQPQTVRYHLLSSMLLNEVQKQQRQIESQGRRIAELQARLRRLEAARSGRRRG